MHLEFNKPRPSEELVEQVGPTLAQHLTDEAVDNELPQLAAAQDFQERVVARQNQLVGFKGADALGQCVARMDLGIFDRIRRKYATEIAADPKKFWLVTLPRLHPELGTKPKYHAPPRIFSPGKLCTA